MANKLFMIPGDRAFNANGLAIPGATASLYATGTLNPQPFYSDSGLTTSLGSTITANGIGRFPLAYQNEATPFRVIIKDASGATLDGGDIDPFYFGIATDYAASSAAAATSASSAASSATSASTSATNAASSATAAASSATSASSSATSASASATSASSSASAASTSATNAASSASSASTSAASLTPVHMGYDNLYSSANDIANQLLTLTGVFIAASGFSTAVIPVAEGNLYAIRFPFSAASELILHNTYGMYVGYSTGPTTAGLISGSANECHLIPTPDQSVWMAYIPTGLNITYIFMAAHNAVFDARTTLTVRLDTEATSALTYVEGTSEIGGGKIRDRKARTDAQARVKNPWYGKYLRTCGDSVTSMGGWQNWIAQNLGCRFYNDGSSGARSGRLVNMMTNGRIANRQEGTNFGTLQPAWSLVDFATILIGTNDLNNGVLNGSSADIPTSVAATGTITFTANPTAGSTITINGTVITFVASGAVGNQVNIGGTAAATRTNLVNFLTASIDANILKAVYAQSATQALTITSGAMGVSGNAFTLAADAGANATLSGATLTGGVNGSIYDVSGVFSPTVRARGTITFSAQPTASSTVTINSVVITFVASGATGNQVNIGADLPTTLSNLKTFLNSSSNGFIVKATYDYNSTQLIIVHDLGDGNGLSYSGSTGNTFTIAASAGSNGTASGATLTGGTDSSISTTDSTSTDAYFNAFPNTFWGNLGICIEYALWKNPRLRLYMIGYPERAEDSTRPVDTIATMQQAIASFYSLPFLNAASLGGVPQKNVSRLTAYETDVFGTNHMNDFGREMFGKWLARRLSAN